MAADDPRPWWRRLTTVRARTTAAATVVVGLGLLVAAVSLVVLLRRSLVHNLDDVADVHAQDVAALAREGALPPDLFASEDTSIVQVVDDGGTVIAATAGRAGDRPVATFVPAGPDAETRTVGRFRMLALRSSAPGGPVTIYVASSLEPVDDTIGLLRGAVAVGAPVILVLVGLTAWVVVGRALRPVEAISAEVADISGRALDRRVPVPTSGDEISRLARTMNTMLDRLQASAEQQRRFVADASHELQTPLASARTDLEVALSHPDATDWPETAADLLGANRRMERLVRDLLFLARADADGMPAPSAVLVDLDAVVLEEARRLRREGRVPVDTSRVSAAAVRGRRDELTRVVRNLLENADHHAATAVTVEASSQNGEVTVVVADDGAGIPAAHRQRVFERFTRLDDARSRDAGGTGLGLAIAKEIVDAHDGHIAIADSPAGTRVVVTLPAG